MIVALFALAAAMVIGGIAAVVQGFPFVRLESGLAMVIAGSGTASAGAVLFGLGLVAQGLKRVERALSGSGATVPVPPSLPAADPFPAPPARVEPSVGFERPVLPAALAAGGLGAVAGAAAAAGPGRPQTEPTFEDALFAALPAEPRAPREPELPMPGLTPAPARTDEPEPAAAPEPDDGLTPEDDLFAAPAEEPVLRPGFDAAPAAQEPPAAPPPAPAEEPEPAPERTVVGRHSSGGNTYVMFADGSIEADTPRGRFTFGSLDELRAFVDAGGERGAA